jgi:anti-sigma B factor antagonist
MAQVPWSWRMADLSIEVQEVEGVAVLLPAGFINAHTVREFEEAMESLVKGGQYTILLNCRNLSYISSAGLGAIMGLIETVREHGGDILLSNLQENVFAIFDTLGFTQLYRVFGDQDQALAAAAPERKG